MLPTTARRATAKIVRIIWVSPKVWGLGARRPTRQFKQILRLGSTASTGQNVTPGRRFTHKSSITGG